MVQIHSPRPLLIVRSEDILYRNVPLVPFSAHRSLQGSRIVCSHNVRGPCLARCLKGILLTLIVDII